MSEKKRHEKTLQFKTKSSDNEVDSEGRVVGPDLSVIRGNPYLQQVKYQEVGIRNLQ